jgi:hypothetical protein
MSVTGFNRRRRSLELASKEEAVPVEIPIESLPLNSLKRLAKKKGVDSFRKTKAELLKELQ